MPKPSRNNSIVQNAGALNLDDTDHQIISQLIASPSTSNVDIANLVNASASTVANRLQNLLEHNVIKVIARLDIKLLGYSRLSMVRIDQPNRELMDALRGQPDVLIATRASTTNTLFAIIAFNHFTTLRTTLYQLLARHAPSASCSINECTEVLKYDFNAAAFNDVSKQVTELSQYRRAARRYCDETDDKILSKITVDARQSNRHIARELSISENTVRKRIGALIDKQLIEIGAVINNSRLFSSHLIFEGEINVPPRYYEAVVEQLKHDKGILFLAHSTGSNNLVFTAMFRDQQALKGFADALDKQAVEKSLHLVHPVPEIFQHEFLVIR